MLIFISTVSCKGVRYRARVSNARARVNSLLVDPYRILLRHNKGSSIDLLIGFVASGNSG